MTCLQENLLQRSNKYGFRGEEFKNNENEQSKLLFGGSTGYNGDPPISELIENKLVIILRLKHNFSSVSSNHNRICTDC